MGRVSDSQVCGLFVPIVRRSSDKDIRGATVGDTTGEDEDGGPEQLRVFLLPSDTYL